MNRIHERGHANKVSMKKKKKEKKENVWLRRQIFVLGGLRLVASASASIALAQIYATTDTAWQLPVKHVIWNFLGPGVELGQVT